MKPTNHKVLLIGEAPNHGGLRSHLLESILLRALNQPAVKDCADAARFWLTILEDMPNSRLASLLPEVRHVNLLDEYPGRKQRGSAFDAVAARRKADYLYLWLQRRPARYPYLLLAGKRVASAFRFGAEQPFKSFPMAGRCVVVVPHPSGINRWWNDASNRMKALTYLSDLGELLQV